MNTIAWKTFTPGPWRERPDVRDFIVRNFTPYTGTASFLADPTDRTRAVLGAFQKLRAQEQERGGVLDIDTSTVSSLLTYGPGYLDQDNELIVGLQTDAPLKRGVNPFGGLRMARKACEAYGYQLDEDIEKGFQYRTTHNDGVYRIYTEGMRAARRCGVITGLPDAYGRGRIIGDYRRVALYGVDQLIAWKKDHKAELGRQPMTEDVIRRSEELWREIDFLEKLKRMAELYGHDISAPARTAHEAIQWVYFAYLGAIKEQNGAAMSLGRVSTFLDIYVERDIATQQIDESKAQELIDDFVLKLRMARQLRTPEYNDLFAGDPTWVTEAIGGVAEDGRPLVTKTSFRFLHTLENLGPAPEPNLTVLWAPELPDGFREYCAQLSIDTDTIQYENDPLMRKLYGDDYGIACCVSAMKIGKQMQFFGARCNLPKILLMALNGGRDEISGEQVGPEMPVMNDDILDFSTVMKRFRHYRAWLAELYVNTMNVIHYMHDKYAYEKLQMALHDTDVERFMAFGVAGLSVVADSLSAIKHAQVRPVHDERGLITDFEVDGEFPCFGNDAPAVDRIAQDQVRELLEELRCHKTYRHATHTLSILTITSNVVYGRKTGATPDGRKQGDPFAPGANPMHNRDELGALASLNSVAGIPYEACRDGVSCTFTVTPDAIGADDRMQSKNLTGILDGYFRQGGHHLNVNVLNREHLIDAMNNPDKYPHLTIRVSGYAVHFNRLNRQQQEEVIARTFHGRI